MPARVVNYTVRSKEVSLLLYIARLLLGFALCIKSYAHFRRVRFANNLHG